MFIFIFMFKYHNLLSVFASDNKLYISLALVSGSMEDADSHMFNYHETPMDGETLKNSISNMMHFVPRSKTTRRQKQRDIEEMARAGMCTFRWGGFQFESFQYNLKLQRIVPSVLFRLFRLSDMPTLYTFIK